MGPCSNEAESCLSTVQSEPLLFFKNLFTNACLLILTWAVPWSILNEECLPGGNVFSLVILIDCCVLAGIFIKKIPIPGLPPLPPLLGMLLAGFALRNIPGINVAKDIDSRWSSALRSLSLTIILVKAGLELDASALKKMKSVCFRLTALPCIAETLSCATFCYLLLGFSLEWGLLLGFVLSAVTPAVIVPSLLDLQEKGYGAAKGIPTLVIAASSFDDVLAISGFSVVLGVTFSAVSMNSIQGRFANSTFDFNQTSTIPTTTTLPPPMLESSNATGSVALTIVKGPLEMLGGILLGCLFGFVFWYIPNKTHSHINTVRTMFVFGIGTLAIFGCPLLGFPGAGPLIAIVAPFVAAFKWGDDKTQISDNMGHFWTLFEPMMFGLIGAEINVENMVASTVFSGLAVLFIGLIFRSLATFAAVVRAGLNLHEKIFVCIAWLPKATVQAAIGPLALDMARKVNAPEKVINLAEQVLTIAVLSILITAPIGAAAIGLSGPKLLERDSSKTGDNQVLPPGDACGGWQSTSSHTSVEEEVGLQKTENITENHL